MSRSPLATIAVPPRASSNATPAARKSSASYPSALAGAKPIASTSCGARSSWSSSSRVELAPGLVGGQRGVPVRGHGERVPGREHRARRLLLPEPDQQPADPVEQVPAAAVCALLERHARGEEVVGLVAVRFRRREAHRLDELRRQVELVEQLLVELAPGLVGGQSRVPVGRHGERVPGGEHGARRLFLPEPDQQAADAVEQVAAAAVGAPDRLRQRVVVAVRERVAVDDQERPFGAQWTAILSATRISPRNPFTAPTASAAGQRS